MNPLDFIGKNFNFKAGGIEISPTYWQAGAILVLLFLLVFSLARLRFMYINWSLGKSAVAMFFWGFLLALIFEGFMIIGGKTLLTELLGWKNAPKPIITALDIGREKMIDAIGISSQIPEPMASEIPTVESVLWDMGTFSPEDMEKLKEIICAQPE